MGTRDTNARYDVVIHAADDINNYKGTKLWCYAFNTIILWDQSTVRCHLTIYHCITQMITIQIINMHTGNYNYNINFAF